MIQMEIIEESVGKQIIGTGNGVILNSNKLMCLTIMKCYWKEYIHYGSGISRDV